MSNNIPTATFTITCWGCNKTIIKPYYDFEDCQRQLQNLWQEGWVKRSFSPTVWSWFCGYNCAYNSLHAQQAEQWWQRHKKENISWGFVASAILFVATMGTVLLEILSR